MVVIDGACVVVDRVVVGGAGVLTSIAVELTGVTVESVVFQVI